MKKKKFIRPLNYDQAKNVGISHYFKERWDTHRAATSAKATAAFCYTTFRPAAEEIRPRTKRYGMINELTYVRLIRKVSQVIVLDKKKLSGTFF